MITIIWDWFSFFSGIVVAMTLNFWVLVWLAFRQWRRTKKFQESSFEQMMTEWGKKK